MILMKMMNNAEKFEQEEKPELEFISSEIQVLEEGKVLTAEEPLIIDIDGHFVKVEEGEEYVIPDGVKHTFAEVYRFKGNRAGLTQEYERMLKEREETKKEDLIR